MTRPNILWFSLEDTSPRFGCFGDRTARTPNLDRLAAEGCRYPNAFSVAAVCAPSRSAIITGMYPTFIGSHHMRTAHTSAHAPELPTPYQTVPPHYVKCFPEYLRAAGYYCTNNDKTDYQFDPPSTAWDECSRQAHWRNRAAGQPFFAVFNPIVTHESGQWPVEGGSPRVTDSAQVHVPPYLPDTPQTRQAIARQYDNIAASDQRLGQSLRELEEDGLLDSTIIFIWSDHGEGLPRAKRWCYDSGIRVPLIVRFPGTLAPGSVDERLVSLIDLAPTVLSLCGLPLPVHLQGRPFLGPQARERDYVYATRDRYDEAYDMVRAVRDRRFKYIRNYHPELPYQLWIPYSYRHPAMQEIWRQHLEGESAGQRLMQASRPPEELYDLDADPHEMNNVAGEAAFAADLERLRGVMDAWRRDYDVYGDVPEDQMVRRWWSEGRAPATVPPRFVVIGPDSMGIEPSAGGTHRGPLLVQLYCPTQGASMGYTLDEGDQPRWRPYAGPIRLERATRVTLRAKAVRIGYAPSQLVSAQFTIQG